MIRAHESGFYHSLIGRAADEMCIGCLRIAKSCKCLCVVIWGGVGELLICPERAIWTILPLWIIDAWFVGAAQDSLWHDYITDLVFLEETPNLCNYSRIRGDLLAIPSLGNWRGIWCQHHTGDDAADSLVVRAKIEQHPEREFITLLNGFAESFHGLFCTHIWILALGSMIRQLWVNCHIHHE